MMKVAIIGGGPAALSLASFIDTGRYEVTIYEKSKALGRKFLVAGKGGFNLTHSEHVSEMIQKYTPQGFLDACVEGFDNVEFREWLLTIGIPTYIGSSHRVFPEPGIKPISVLKAIEKNLTERGVKVHTEHTWKGEKLGDIHIYALGGASWPVTGSDGLWTDHFRHTKPFSPSNCAFHTRWSASLAPQISGLPLKNIVVSHNNKSVKGEVMLTSKGLEGGAIYALSGELLQGIRKQEYANLNIDLKKDLTEDKISTFLSQRKSNITQCLKKEIKLEKQAVSLLKHHTTKEEFQSPAVLASKIKQLTIKVYEPAPIDEAISTTGGIRTDALDENFQLLSRPGHYAIGEMVDWDAPTGGYLLQACFSMGHHLARMLNEA